MTHRLLRSSPFSPRKVKDFSQKFRYLLVLDLEATCQKHGKLEPQEIIELPCLALCTETWEVRDAFHSFIKPKVHPSLTWFCTDLTGIIQEMIDDCPYFPEVFQNFEGWLSEGEYFKTPDQSAFVTCGDWDLRVMLPAQCQLDQIPLPCHYEKWINLKHIFSDATKYYPRSLKDMLGHLKLPALGRLHSGLDDTHNMTRIIKSLVEKYEFNLNITSDVGQNQFKFHSQNSGSNT